jgi:two-component system cell cycle sensor histidine kinase/response regulator CckA
MTSRVFTVAPRRAVLTVVVGFLLALGVFGTFVSLNHEADEHETAEVLVSEVETILAHVVNVPHDVALEGAAAIPEPVVRARLNAMEARIRFNLRALERLEPGPAMRRIRDLHEEQASLLQQELEAIAAHDQARTNATHDAAYVVGTKLERELPLAKERFNQRAAQARTYTLLGTAAVLFALFLAFTISVALLVRAHERSRAGDERLRQAQKLEAVGQLAGGIAHDFNNLLVAIRGFAELARSTLDPASPAHRDVGEVIAASDRAATMTRQLLAFSRDQVLVPVVLDPNAAVRETLTLLERLLGEDIHVDVDLAPDLPCIEVDSGRFGQVIVNLALNARDVMPSGGRLLIATSLTDDGVLISVSDTGSGIEEQVREHLFEPFFTTKEEDTGSSGLGLATVWAIVTTAGGHVEVETQLGHGTTFHIHLPVTDKPLASLTDEVRGTDPEASPGTVLVVDDNDAVRDFVVRLLERAGHRVLQTNDGNDALELVAGELYDIDLLITDLSMPGLSGQDLALRLDHLPVLFMSGHPKDLLLGDRHTAFIQKPFTAADLTSAVDRLLTQRQLPDMHAV